MKKETNLLLGILLTLIIYGLGIVTSRVISFEHEFIPKSFITHSTMLIFSIIVIIYFKTKTFFSFHFKKVKFKFYIYGVLIAIAGFIIAQMLATLFLTIFGFEMDPSGRGHAGIEGISSIQFFIFVFIYASICEEFLFRGFAQNFFQPLSSIRLNISNNVYISLPVVLSGVLFGLGHLILLSTNTSGPMVFRIVIMTWIGGTIAGYFQEKHQNILPAIVVHMTLNLPGLIMSFIL